MSKSRDIADSAATINFIDTVTSNVQDQLDNLDPVPTNIAGGSAGTIPYQSAVNTTAMLAVGTAGQVLQTNGAAAPTWVTPAGGAMVLLSTVTASNSATVDLETAFNSTYDQYLIIAAGVKTANDGDGVWCRMKIGGSYLTTNTYTFICPFSSNSNGTFNSTSGANVAQITLVTRLGNAASRNANFAMYVNNPASTSLTKNVYFQSSSIDDSGNLLSLNGTGFNSGTSALTGIRFFGSSGNLSSGTFRLYGIVNS